MNIEDLQAEIAELLRQSRVSKSLAIAAADGAIASVYATVKRIASCPICERPFTFEEPKVSYSTRITCPSCQATCVVTCGVVRSKRANTSSELMTDLGLFIRFLDAANRERYAALQYFTSRVELKSKDLVSICVAEDLPATDLWLNRDPGKACVMNLTLNTAPAFGEIWKRAELLKSLQN